MADYYECRVSQEKYDRWINNCKKSKTNTSWIYLGKKRKKVYSMPIGDELEIYFYDGDNDYGGLCRYEILPEKK